MKARLQRKLEQRKPKRTEEELIKHGEYTMYEVLDFPDFHFINDHPHLDEESKYQWIETVLQIFQMETVKQLLSCCWFNINCKKACIRVLAMAQETDEPCGTTFIFNHFYFVYRIRKDKTCKLEKLMNYDEFEKFLENKNRKMKIITFSDL